MSPCALSLYAIQLQRKAAVYPLYNPSTSPSPCHAQAAELYSSTALNIIQLYSALQKQPLHHPSERVA
eukprot:6553541-Prymnesium_polylepis.1